MSDWIRNRGRCTLEQAFKDLVQVIERDVREVMALERPGVRFDTEFLHEEGRPQRLLVSKFNTSYDSGNPTEQVMLAYVGPEIHFYKNHRNMNPTSKLRVEWEHTAQACLYVLEGEASAASINLEDISQALLEPLFFG